MDDLGDIEPLLQSGLAPCKGRRPTRGRAKRSYQLKRDQIEVERRIGYLETQGLATTRAWPPIPAALLKEQRAPTGGGIFARVPL